MGARLRGLRKRVITTLCAGALIFGFGVPFAQTAAAYTLQACVQYSVEEQCSFTDGGQLWAWSQNDSTVNFNGYENFVIYANQTDCGNAMNGSTAWKSGVLDLDAGDFITVPAPSGTTPTGWYRIRFIRNDGNKYATLCFHFTA